MKNKDFYSLEKKSIDYLRSYVNHDEFVQYFNEKNYACLHTLFKSIPINEDCKLFIDEYSARMEHHRSTLTHGERNFLGFARVVWFEFDMAMLYLCLGLFEDEICKPLS